VSRSPLVGSVIETLVNHCIEVCTKSAGIDPWCAGRCLRERCSEYEPPLPDGSQLRNRRSVARHYDGLACLNFAKDGSRLIPKLALVNDSAHGQM
jgi:hypothetical protein